MSYEYDVLGLGSGVEAVERLTRKSEVKDYIEVPNVGLMTEKNLSHVRKDIPKRQWINLRNLKSLVSLIKQEKNAESPVLLNVGEVGVEVYGGLDEYMQREHLYSVNAQVPNIEFDYPLDVEKMIIQLQTNFLESENKKALISMISKLTNEQSIELQDDGISQKVVSKQGITAGDVVTLPPLVKLIPQRTFFEVPQVEQMFLIRVERNGQVTLYEAEGGAWKYDAQTNIREYLESELKDLIEEGKVIVA